MKRKQAKERAKILIVDDHPAVREALALRIGRQANLEVCGEAAEINEAMKFITKSPPDLAIIDISLKNGNGLDLIKRIKDRFNSVRMLVWSMHSESLYAERALRAGALGYINKDQATDKIIDAIQHVLDGKVFVSETMAQKVLQRAIGGKQKESSQLPLEVLADRELEVFQFIGKGMKTADIAKQLHLSVKTVETYRDRIRLKLGLSHGTELVRYATQWDLENG